MKLHKDGTVEGTPQEISEYMKMQGKPMYKDVLPPAGTWPRILDIKMERL